MTTVWLKEANAECWQKMTTSSNVLLSQSTTPNVSLYGLCSLTTVLNHFLFCSWSTRAGVKHTILDPKSSHEPKAMGPYSNTQLFILVSTCIWPLLTSPSLTSLDLFPWVSDIDILMKKTNSAIFLCWTFSIWFNWKITRPFASKCWKTQISRYYSSSKLIVSNKAVCVTDSRPCPCHHSISLNYFCECSVQARAISWCSWRIVS